MSDADKNLENAKQQLAANREAQDKARDESLKIYDPSNSKPTPTQEENDLARLGANVTEHEPDGSPEQPPGPQMARSPMQTRQIEPRRGQQGQYQTRATAPQRPAGE